MLMKLKHEGFQLHRLNPNAGNPREVAFAAQWAKEQEYGKLLFHLLPDSPTQRDANVAATVAQWLGSNVGMSFLEEVIRDSPEVQNWLKQRSLCAK